MKAERVIATRTSGIFPIKCGEKFRVLARPRRFGMDFLEIKLADGRVIAVLLGDSILGTFKPVKVI